MHAKQRRITITVIKILILQQPPSPAHTPPFSSAMCRACVGHSGPSQAEKASSKTSFHLNPTSSGLSSPSSLSLSSRANLTKGRVGGRAHSTPVETCDGGGVPAASSGTAAEETTGACCAPGTPKTGCGDENSGEWPGRCERYRVMRGPAGVS